MIEGFLMQLRRWLSLLSFLAVLGTAPLAAQRNEVRPPGTALDLAPFGARTLANRSGLEIAPLLAGGLVLVNSTRRLHAVDAATGALGCWSTPALHGWEALDSHLINGVDPAGLLVQAAAGERVVVASLQLPFSRSNHEDWQGIPIMVALPERRLFAFELASGRPLWNHAPSVDRVETTAPF